MRLMGFLFLSLTFLAGITIGSVQTALINVVVFLALALLVARFLEPRFGNNGLAFGMAGAFFASFSWPIAVIAFGVENSDEPATLYFTDQPETSAQ